MIETVRGWGTCLAHLLCEEHHSIKSTSGRPESPGQRDIL